MQIICDLGSNKLRVELWLYTWLPKNDNENERNKKTRTRIGEACWKCKSQFKSWPFKHPYSLLSISITSRSRSGRTSNITTWRPHHGVSRRQLDSFNWFVLSFILSWSRILMLNDIHCSHRLGSASFPTTRTRPSNTGTNTSKCRSAIWRFRSHIKTRPRTRRQRTPHW